jgi:hypothetical protein
MSRPLVVAGLLLIAGVLCVLTGCVTRVYPPGPAACCGPSVGCGPVCPVPAPLPVPCPPSTAFCLPQNPGRYSDTMHPAISPGGQTYLIPQQELRTLMQPQ